MFRTDGQTNVTRLIVALHDSVAKAKVSWTDRVRNEEVLHRVKKERNVIYSVKRRKANWIGHILRRNCLLKHIIEGKRR